MPRLTAALTILLLSLLLHLVEELLTGFRKQFPLGEMSVSLFVGINAVIYSFLTATIWLSYHGRPIAIPMAWLFAAAMSLNGGGHLGIMLVRGAYFPGGFTTLILLAASVNVLFQLRDYTLKS
jgi:hypothetical protein